MHMPDLLALNRRYGPWIALALGVAGVAFMRQGLSFAPVAVGLLLLAWIAAEAIRRWTATLLQTDVADASPTGWRRFALPAAGSLIAGLWQNILFYLLPLWWASAVLLSWNMAFPLLLTAMALLSCFEHHWQSWVMENRVVQAIWSAIVLFAALLPVAGLVAIPLRYSVGLCAALAALLTCLALINRLRGAGYRPLIIMLAAMAATSALAIWAAPVMPPVPVVRAASGMGTAIRERELEGASGSFPAGVERVYAWFAVAAPANYRQNVRFEWFHNGLLASAPRDTQIVGGRREGFRTWTWRARPAPGNWRVDLRTDSGQLVARETFEVK